MNKISKYYKVKKVVNVGEVVKRRKKMKTLYHITSLENAKKIVKEGFKIGKSTAFGKGIYFSSSVKHLKHYDGNAIIVANVSYNKKLLNTSHFSKKPIWFENKKMTIQKLFEYAFENNKIELALKTIDEQYANNPEYKESRPKYMTPKKGYDVMYNEDIWVIPSNEQIAILCYVVVE